MKTAKIAVENAAYHFDKLYDYLMDGDSCLKPGTRVIVPFGRGGHRTGLIVEISEETERENSDAVKLKKIICTADSEPVLSGEMLAVLRFLKENVYCTWFDALKAMLPVGFGIKSLRNYVIVRDAPIYKEPLLPIEHEVLQLLSSRKKPISEDEISKILGVVKQKLPLAALESKGLISGSDAVIRRIGDKTMKMLRLTGEEPSRPLTGKQRQLYELLENVGCASLREACYFTGVGKTVADKLVKSGAAVYFDEEVYRSPFRSGPVNSSVGRKTALSPEQQKAADILTGMMDKAGGTALLHGVTGSGKTLVYMSVIDKAVSEGKKALVLVPEIALTPQTIERFRACYGQRAAVMHSGLSMSERLDEWKRIRAGLADVVVGTRSAIFAPLENLGVIVIDEEQEHTYKSESSPRYDAREIAAFRARYNGALLLLTSATPSVDSYYRAQKGDYTLVELKERFGGASLPDVYIIDMHTQGTPLDAIGTTLCTEIEKNLADGKQTILLMNRRGHSNIVTCMNCHTPISCPNCSVSLNYHAANGRMMCHYCGYSVPMARKCDKCGGENIRFGGIGTQKVQEQLAEIFPDARILRMDTDATMRKYSHQRMLDDFAAGKYDILVGTQMVAKGLDFPNVTLVGVLTMDQALYCDNFRSYEQAFDLITQVVGRSGRNKARGRAYIQTYTPESPVIAAAAKQDYRAFYEQEIKTRRLHLYPPFCRIYCIGITGESERLTLQTGREIMERLTGLLKNDYPSLPVRVLGLSDASVLKVAGKYRRKILVKVKNSPKTRELFSVLLAESLAAAPKEVSVFIDPAYDSGL